MSSKLRLLGHRCRRLTGRWRMLPDFLMIGAQKSGTTFLYHVLQGHPDVMRASKKAVHFFDDPANFRYGANGYRSHFPLVISHRLRHLATKRNILTGEASPYYLAHAPSAQRAAQLVPHAKILILLRNPIGRAYSHYQMMHRSGRDPLSFEEALSLEDERLESEAALMQAEPFYSLKHRWFSYRSRGHYLEQIQQWEQFFPRSQMLILNSEKLFQETPQALQETFAFLGLAPWQPSETKARGEGRYTEPMKNDTREELRRYFEPHNRQLYQYLGTDFGWDKAQES